MKSIAFMTTLILAFSRVLQAEPSKQITVPLSDPDESGVLLLDHHKGSVHVTGYEGRLVIITATMQYESDELPAESVQLGVLENDNQVVLSAAPPHRTIDLDIVVPHRFSVRIKKDDRGVIAVGNLTGELEISNLNDDIVLTDISGSAVCDTIDGDMTVQFQDVASDVPMAFSTVEGSIDVTFPADAPVLVKARTDHGTIRNDMDRDSGRVEISLRSYWGDIQIKSNENHRIQSSPVTPSD